MSSLTGLLIWKSKMAMAGSAISAAIALLMVFAPLVATHSPSKITLDMLSPPSPAHYFGTDSYGRDIFSRVVMATRDTMAVAALSLSIGFLGGLVLGVLGGYIRGKLELLLNRVTDLAMSFPSIMIALFIIAIYGSQGKNPLILAIGLTIVPRMARVIRGATLPIVAQEYVHAARALGGTSLRILIRHVLPNLVGTLVVLISLYLPEVILLEASLSFLGLGPPPDVPTWGRIISDGRAHIRTAPWVTIFPGSMIMITVIGFNLLGDGLRDLLDPKGRGRLRQAGARLQDGKA